MKFIKDNEVYSLQEIYDLFPNISFPVGFDVKELGFLPLLDTLPPENTETQYAVLDGWKEEDGKYITKWKLVDYTKNELEEIASQKEKDRKQEILSQITSIELSITERRIREAILGVDNGWLANVDAQIKALRSKL